MERYSTGRNDGHAAKAVVLAMGVLLTGVLCLGAALQAQPQDPAEGRPGPGACPGRHGCMGGLEGLSQRLGLSEEQMGKIESLRLEFDRETLDLDGQIRQKHLAFANLLRDPEAKEDAITAARQELTKLAAEKEEKAHAFRMRARGILTPEQIRNLPPGCCLGIPCAGDKGCGMGRGRGGCPQKM